MEAILLGAEPLSAEFEEADIDRVGLKKLRVGLMQQRVGQTKQRVGLMQQRVGLRKQRVGLLEIKKCDVCAKLGTRRCQGGSVAVRSLDIVNHKRGLIEGAIMGCTQGTTSLAERPEPLAEGLNHSIIYR